MDIIVNQGRSIRMLKRLLNFLVVILFTFCFASLTVADVHKWKDSEGVSHYGDAPPIAGTAVVHTDKQTADQFENAARIRSETASILSVNEQDSRCEDLLEQLKYNELGDIGSKAIPEIFTIKAKRNEINQEYKLRCGSASAIQRPAIKSNNAKCKGLLDQLKNNEVGDMGSKTIPEIYSIKAKRNEVIQEYMLLCGSDSEIKAYQEEKKSSRRAREIRCTSDFDCGSGSVCMKQLNQYNGICAKSLDKYGNQLFNAPRPDSINPKSKPQCTYDGDCAPGFRCDKKYEACVK